MTDEGISAARQSQIATELAAVFDGLRTGAKPALKVLSIASWMVGVRSRFDWQNWWGMAIFFVWLLMAAAGFPTILRATTRDRQAVDRHRVATIERFKASMAQMPPERSSLDRRG